MAKSAAWQRKEGKNPKGGLNEKGRKAYEPNQGFTFIKLITLFNTGTAVSVYLAFCMLKEMQVT
jgi:hypothetical protein